MREIDVSAITNNVLETDLFVTREFGQILTPKFEGILNSSVENVFVFDFANIKFTDFSCPNEVFGHLLNNLKNYGDKYIFLKGLDESKRENINIALNEEKRAMLEITEDNNFEVIGHLPEFLKELLLISFGSKEDITARKIADLKDTKISTASSKLLTLWKQGLLIRREIINEEGKQFLYKSVNELIIDN
ncbi:hypothetical protein [Lysinibacillus xylanilyticus]|uniref:hypothetical protein n=1 Tax=Lysinibacillus xylanilyticus TaxID=582475 RepID=UPI003D047842